MAGDSRHARTPRKGGGAEQGVDALSEALCTPFHEIVLARVAATRPDLVVKHSEYHNRIERTLFMGSDWHLIRDCPVPLLLVKDPGKLAGARVLVCVDRLTRTTSRPRSIASCSNGARCWPRPSVGELHLLNVCAIPTPIGVVGGLRTSRWPPCRRTRSG